MKKALVTGCAGFIGSHLIEKLLEENWNILGLDNFHPYYDKRLKVDNLSSFLHHKNFQFFEGSILSENDLSSLDFDFDCIFHLLEPDYCLSQKNYQKKWLRIYQERFMPTNYTFNSINF